MILSELILKFTKVSSIKDMPRSEMCSECYIKKLAMMQSSPYSYYSDMYKEDLELVYKTCGKSGPTVVPPPLVSQPEKSTMCISDNYYTTTSNGETCEQVAYLKNVSTVALYHTNPQIFDCSNISSGKKLPAPVLW
ncbi:hypothetical protein SNK04_013855 [Fusarium graminearum]